MSASRDHYRTDFDDQSSRTYHCECGNEYINEGTLQQHQQNQCQKRSTACSFCEEKFPSSSNELRVHLLLCGNKTDECPKCRQFIRRSHFAYHYENNCAAVNQVETPPLPRHRSALHPPNSNKPVSRVDIPDENSPMYSPRNNGRIQTPRSNPQGNGTVIRECEFCRHRCTEKDYDIHVNNCLQNPTNAKNRSRVPLASNQNKAGDTTHIPCEFCDQPVDIAHWSRHIQSCREREDQRIATRARQISAEPVTEQIPCEYCHNLFSVEQLEQHQDNCPHDPDRMESAARMARRAGAKPVSLPVRSRNNSRTQPRNVEYQSIDHDRTRATNREADEHKRVDSRSPIQCQPIDDIPPQPTNYRPNDYAYDNRRHSQDDLDGLNRPRTANGTGERHRGSFDALLDDKQHKERGERPSNHRLNHRTRSAHGSYEQIDNRPGFYSEKKKKAWWKFLCCGMIS